VTDPGPTVRPAEPDDAPALGRLHIRAWPAAYRGLMPDDYLDGLDPAERGQMWARALTSPGTDVSRFVVCAAGRGDPVGFAIVGPVRESDSEHPRLGELYAINLDPESWGQGMGRLLLSAATEELRRRRFADAVLWVATGNTRARRFYEAAGWFADGTERTDNSFGPPVDETRYRRELDRTEPGGSDA